MKIKEVLENAWVITMGGERLEQFRRSFDAVGLDSSLVREWRACVLKGEGEMGNSISQYSLVRMAKERDLPFLVIFEDDAVPSDDAAAGIERQFNERKDDCLCLSLGWSWDSDPDVGEDLTKHRKIFGSHAFALFGQKAYDEYLTQWEKCGRADIVIHSMTGARLGDENLFAQHTVGQSMHLPAGWSADAYLEKMVSDDATFRFRQTEEVVNQMKKERTIHVAYAVDVQGRGAQQFCDQLLTSVYSIKKSMTKDDIVCVHILYGNIPAQLMHRINKLQTDVFKTDFKQIAKHEMDYMQTLTKHSPKSDIRSWCGIVFARLWLPLAIRDVDRILYLDCDTMVRGSLRELYKTDLKGNLLGMVMGSIFEYGYNSGMILMDAKTMREDQQLWQDLAKFLEENSKKYYCPDQTSINRFFNGKILELDRKYNYPPNPVDGEPGFKDAVVWHWFNGTQKPTRIDREDFGKSMLIWNETEKAAEAETN